MANHINGLDHALIGVTDLEAARRSYDRLGFDATPRGEHTGRGTANYCYMFETGYLELLGVIDPAQDRFGIGANIAARGDGIERLALATDSAVAAQSDINATGLKALPAQALERVLSAEAGGGKIGFELVLLDEPPPLKSLFLCHHLTPERTWQPQWKEHRNTAVALRGVILVADHPPHLQDQIIKLFGMSTVTPTDHAIAVHLGSQRLLIVSPTDMEVMFPNTYPAKTPPVPFFAAVQVAVRDLTACRTALAEGNVPFHVHDAEGGTLRVAPAEAHGVLFEFIQA